MQIILKGTNKKLLQQCGANEHKANLALDNGNETMFLKYLGRAKRKLNLIVESLMIDKSKYIVAPGKKYSSLVLIEKWD